MKNTMITDELVISMRNNERRERHTDKNIRIQELGQLHQHQSIAKKPDRPKIER